MTVLVGDRLGAELAAFTGLRLGLQRHIADPFEDRTERLGWAHGVPACESSAKPQPVAGSNATGCGLVPSEIGVATA